MGAAMPRRAALLAVVALGALAAWAGPPPALSGAPAPMASSLQAQLRLLAEKKVFFAHQSVGQNVLEGLAALAREEGVPLPIEPLGSGAAARPGVVHALVGRNEDPLGKVRAFEALLAGGAGHADLALMKLCYVDFNPSTDVAALFDAYRRSHEALQKAHPGLVLVHVTAPLSTVQGGVKGWLKGALGRAPAGAREDVKRHQFNELLRRTWSGREPIFDLAAVEAGAGPSACSFELDGQRWPCLQPALTDDGGHLNAEGRKRAARALVETLAGALKAL